ncbi:MAG: TVP38/TMEM64 family protein [Planctomycetota bacterium]|nr:TVP38/TMEM64 family protein [Planctomycetota bacterium]
MTHPKLDTGRQQQRRGALPYILLVAILIVGGYLVSGHNPWTLEPWLQREEQLRQLHADRPLVVYGTAFLLYVGVTACSLPFATVLSCSYAWLLGFVPALVLVSFASTSGATVAFLLCRYLVGEPLQKRFSHRLAGFNRALARDGAWYLLTLRLTAVVPFFVVNAVMGLTRIRVWTFWWVSQLGMLPGTCLYVYAGSSMPHLDQLAQQGVRGIVTPQIFVALVLLGVFPLLVKKSLDLVNRKAQANSTVNETRGPL